MLTKPLFVANELSKLIEIGNKGKHELQFRFLLLAATQKTEELRFIHQILDVLLEKELQFENYFNDYYDKSAIEFLNYRFHFGTSKQGSFKYEIPSEIIINDINWVKFTNTNAWEEACGKIFFSEPPTFGMKMYQIISNDEIHLSLHYLLYLAGCSIIATGNHKLQDHPNIKILKDNLIWAAMLSFNVKKIEKRFEKTKISKSYINDVFAKTKGQFNLEVLKRCFETENNQYFTDFTQINYQGLPEHPPESFKIDQLTNGFLYRFNNWAEFISERSSRFERYKYIFLLP
ncbi:hypothetical protein ACQ4LE_003539 [Meloidogyne hapla]